MADSLPDAEPETTSSGVPDDEHDLRRRSLWFRQAFEERAAGTDDANDSTKKRAKKDDAGASPPSDVQARAAMLYLLWPTHCNP